MSVESVLDVFVTFRDFFRYAVSQFEENKLFFGHGNDSAFDEAAHLCLRSLCLPPEHLDPFLDVRLLAKEKQKILHLMQGNCSTGKPVRQSEHRFLFLKYPPGKDNI